jgi:phosphoesterase RecJ-like protein
VITPWRQRPSEIDWADGVEVLRSARSALLLAHVSPDGDALGSALAVGLALEALGRAPQVSFGDDPFVVPRILGFLPGQHLLVPPSTIDPHPDVVATFDASSIERLGLLRAVAEDAPEFMAVDHHASYTGFARRSLCEVGAPATAALALRLIDGLGVRLTPDIATCLYVGVLTDTGSFRYAATTPAVHEVAARLLATGIRHDEIARAIYDSAPFGYVRVLGAALDRAQLDVQAAQGLGMVHTTVPLADRLAAGLGLDSVEPVIDAVRVAEEAEVAVVLKEHEDGSWRVSMRSRGRIDVSDVCIALGGGGHRYAAGYTSTDDAPSTMAAIRRALEATELIPAG